jgi:hypothetical protein
MLSEGHEDGPGRAARVQGYSIPLVDTEGDFYTVEEAATVLERTPGRVRQMFRYVTLEGEVRLGNPPDYLS